MTTDCTHCPLRKRDLFSPFSEVDLAAMQRFKMGELVVDAGTPLMTEGSDAPQMYTALRGMGLRYKTLEDGRRQVVNFVFPGDFIGLQAGVMRRMGHSVEATTRMTLCVFDRSAFFSFLQQNAERGYDMIWLAAMEETFLGDALATIGQRTAAERIAWAMTRIMRRAEALGLGDGHSAPLPYRQQDLADALGLSLVHTNKTLSKLRASQAMSWSDGRLTISDAEALARMGGTGMDPAPVRPLM